MTIAPSIRKTHGHGPWARRTSSISRPVWTEVYTSDEPVTIALQDHHLTMISMARKALQRLASQAADLTSKPLRGNGALSDNTLRYGIIFDTFSWPWRFAPSTWRTRILFRAQASTLMHKRIVYRPPWPLQRVARNQGVRTRPAIFVGG